MLIRVFIADHLQVISVRNFGGQHCGRRLWVRSDANRRVGKVCALAHVIATDAAY